MDTPGGTEIQLSEALIRSRVVEGVFHICDCGAVLEKLDGCNYVRCIVVGCGAEWCWVCKRHKHTECQEAGHNSH